MLSLDSSPNRGKTVLCIIIFALLLLLNWHKFNGDPIITKPKLAPQKIGVPQAVLRAPTAPESSGSPTIFASMTVPIEELDENTRRERAKQGRLLLWTGEPDSTTIYALTDRQDDVYNKIETILRSETKKIALMLKKRNAAVSPLPWKLGTKVQLKGLEPKGVAAINSSLQTELISLVDESIIGELGKRFRVETEIYTHSVEAEVIDRPELKGQGLIVGGRGYIPTWFHVIERDVNGAIVSDYKVNDSLGYLGMQMLTIKR